MKKMFKYTYIALASGCLYAFSACDEDINDFRKTGDAVASNEVFIEAAEQTVNYTIVYTVNEGGKIYLNGTQEVDTILVKFPVHASEPALTETKVKFIRDNELVSVYNAKHETAYAEFPGDNLTSKTSLTIPAGATVSKDSVSYAYTGKLPDAAIPGFDGAVGEKTYLMPLKLLSVTGEDATVKLDDRITYVIVKVIQKIGVKFSALSSYVADIPVGNNTWNGSISFSLAKQAIDGDLNVSLAVDNSLVTAPYKAVSGSLSAVNVLMAGTASTATGTLTCPNLSTVGYYMLPLAIKSVTGVDGAAPDNSANVCNFFVRAYEQSAAAETVSIAKTGTATDAATEASLGTKQTVRTGYAVDIRDAATYLTRAPYSTSYPHINMVTDGTGYTYFNPTTAIALNVVIDLGKDESGITGFELDGYSSTASRWAKSYDVGYATSADFLAGKEKTCGTIDDCSRYVYGKFSAPITARYIIFRNVVPTLTSSTRYIGWSQFYIFK